MNYEQVIAHFGSQSAVARALGVSQPAVCLWRSRAGTIPLLRQLQIEKVTKGKLKASAEAHALLESLAI